MTLVALALVLASAVLHALWNALLKKAANLEAAAMAIQAVALASTAAAIPFLPGPVFPDGPALGWALAAGAFEGLYFLALARTLAVAPLGWSYTWMRGSSILLVWPLSCLLLDERARPLAAAGVLVLVAGLACMGQRHGRKGSRRGLGWALAVGACIGGYTLFYKLSLVHGTHPVALFAVAMAVSLPIQVGVRLVRDGWSRAAFIPTQWPRLVLAGVLCTGSFVLYLTALTLGGAGALATLRNTAVVFAMLFGWIQGERPSRLQWAGAALVAAGAVGLAWR